jgi:xanthine dehydrogenase iron-sulfur cluster and FAD-binding subunit A
MWAETISVTSIEQVLQTLAERGNRARIVAGATDLILEIERGVRPGIDTLVDVSRIQGLDQIALDEDGFIHLGPLVTHNHCVGSKLICDHAYPLARACWEVGSPQIRNRGTVAGNLITASPANDTITPLMALGAWVQLQALRNGVIVERRVPLDAFYSGVRRTVMQPDEMLVDIAFPALQKNQRGHFYKYALRRAQAISLVNAAVVLTMDGSSVQDAKITLGAVAPTIVHAVEAEEYLRGKDLNEETIREAAELAVRGARPISDVRGSAGYRSRMVKVSVQRGLTALAERKERVGMPENPVLLRGKSTRMTGSLEALVRHSIQDTIVTRINGKEYEIEGGQQKTLLRLLREDALLIGSKEGCAEGECGSCTVFLDGVAVLSCMVPAARAHGAEIVTIEGLAQKGDLHPVQSSFIEYGAVQCGYCTPGFLMSAAKLLEERERPSVDEIRHAISGNLCRCTGYYKIIEAIDFAAEKMHKK